MISALSPIRAFILSFLDLLLVILPITLQFIYRSLQLKLGQYIMLVKEDHPGKENDKNQKKFVAQGRRHSIEQGLERIVTHCHNIEFWIQTQKLKHSGSNQNFYL